MDIKLNSYERQLGNHFAKQESGRHVPFGYGSRVVESLYNLTQAVTSNLPPGQSSTLGPYLAQIDLMRGWPEMYKQKHNRDPSFNWTGQVAREAIRTAREMALELGKYKPEAIASQ